MNFINTLPKRSKFFVSLLLHDLITISDDQGKGEIICQERLMYTIKLAEGSLVRYDQIGQFDRFEIVPSAPKSAPTMFYKSSISHTLVIYLTTQVF